MGRSNISLARKKQLDKPDKFMEFINNLIQAVVENKQRLYIALGVVFAGLFIFIGIRYYVEKTGEKALILLSAAMSKYNSLEDKNATNPSMKAVEEELQGISDKYSERVGGKIARLVLANMYYNDHQYKKAIPLYKKGLKDYRRNPDFHDMILGGLAYSYEAINDEKSSAKYFDQIVAETGSLMKGDALFNLGRYYNNWGEKEKSIEAYRQIVGSYKEYFLIDVVKDKIAELESANSVNKSQG